MGAAVAHLAAALYLAVGAGAADRAAVFPLAVRAGVAHRAVLLLRPVRASLSCSTHRSRVVMCGRPAKTGDVASKLWEKTKEFVVAFHRMHNDEL